MSRASIPTAAGFSTAPVERFFQFSLLGMLASGYFAVVGSGFLDWPTTILTGSALAVRAVLAAGVVRLEIPPRIVNALTLVYLCFYPLDQLYFSRELLAASVHLVFFLAIVKILTARTPRDYFYLQLIAFLELLAASAISANLSFFLFLALFLWFTVATLSSYQIRRQMGGPTQVSRGGWRRFAWRLGGLSVPVVLGILLLTGALFFLLPRTARAAFQHLAPERFHLPGFSNEVTLGQIGQLLNRNDAVMHVRLFQPERGLRLKWRGTALGAFDGKRWYNPLAAQEPLRVEEGMLRLADNRQRWRKGRRISYEVHRKALLGDVLFVAGLAEFIRMNTPVVLRISGGGGFRIPYAGGDVRYGVYSFLEDEAAEPAPERSPLSATEREAFLGLPPMDPRIAALTHRLTDQFAGDVEKARALEDHLRRNYGYTTELLSRPVRDPLAHFLFERKRGHCEYYASAMAVMLRGVGIPSRVVTGFQSGVFNPISGWHLIRASDAHSWVEAHLAGRGWMSFDPTPADPVAAGATVWSRLALWLDAAESFWSDWVLGYDLERQLVLADRMGESSRSLSLDWYNRLGTAVASWKHAVTGWIQRFGTAVLAAGVALVFLWLAGPRLMRRWRTSAGVRRLRLGQASASDAGLLYARMLELLKRRGVEKPSWLTPLEFAWKLPPSPSASLVRELTASYNELRFGGRREAAGRMLALLGELERVR